MQDNYNSISSIVFWLTNTFVVKVRVSLYKFSNNYINSFYKEFYAYNDNHHQNMVSVALNYNYSLTLETIRPDPYTKENGYMPIDYGGMVKMSSLLNQALKWFIDPEYNGVWGQYNGELIVTKLGKSFCIDDSFGNCPFTIIPHAAEINGLQIPCCLITFTQHEISSIITLDRLYNAIAFFDRFEPASYAQLLINYLQIPAPGTNRIDINHVKETEVLHPIDRNGLGVPGRKIGDKKLDDL